ncbi:MAG: hypothetical protein QXL77_03615 [Candidatus Bathyarchaeia archaeon]|nr:hypothetical protein [Candidatus Bathyarchaeota archaeon]
METELEETLMSDASVEKIENEEEQPIEGECVQTEEADVEKEEQKREEQEDRSSFVHGLSVGLGIGCIATFVIMWITVFFSPMLPSTITYESLLSVFIYPLIYLLAVGLVALTAGIVREYYVRKE